jgi:hypothetical protein
VNRIGRRLVMCILLIAALAISRIKDLPLRPRLMLLQRRKMPWT